MKSRYTNWMPLTSFSFFIFHFFTSFLRQHPEFPCQSFDVLHPPEAQRAPIFIHGYHSYWFQVEFAQGCPTSIPIEVTFVAFGGTFWIHEPEDGITFQAAFEGVGNGLDFGQLGHEEKGELWLFYFVQSIDQFGHTLYIARKVAQFGREIEQ